MGTVDFLGSTSNFMSAELVGRTDRDNLPFCHENAPALDDAEIPELGAAAWGVPAPQGEQLGGAGEKDGGLWRTGQSYLNIQ